MTAPLSTDWVKALQAQGVPEEDIALAQNLAARHAEAANEHPHDPLTSADPAAFMAFLRDQAH